ncbi:glutathione S-transferase family protein [Aliisedimentitalea scapharcae]
MKSITDDSFCHDWQLRLMEYFTRKFDTMLTLLTYPGNTATFSLSPFCVKAAMLLAQSGQPWQREDLLDPRKMPHQKLPVMKTGERLVADSDSIRDWLEQAGMDFDPGLTPEQKAHSRALIHMAEDHLYFHIVQDRWANDTVWPIIRDIFFVAIPRWIRRPISNSIRKSVLRGLGFQGTSRFSQSERHARLEKDLVAIANLLGDRPFLFGEQVTAADLSMGPMLSAMMETPIKTELNKRISDDPVLSAYAERVRKAVPLP